MQNRGRSGLRVVLELIGLVKPLCGWMVLAVVLGLSGHLVATGITVLAGYALLDVLGSSLWVSVRTAFMCMVVFALVRGLFRYGEQTCNHYIAFKLLALIRDKVFFALRRLCPSKLEGRDRGDLIAVITSDIELLEVFYAHTISPFLIALLYSILVCMFLGLFDVRYAWIAGVSYVLIGIVVPLVMHRLSKDVGRKQREESGALSAFVLESLRGVEETIQYSNGEERSRMLQEFEDELSCTERKMKRNAGVNESVSNALILCTDLCVLLLGLSLCKEGKEFAYALIPFLTVLSSFGPISALAALGSSLQATFGAGNRVLDLLEEEAQVKDVTGKEEVVFAGGDTEHLCFGYDEEEILHDLSLSLPERQVIGIAGRSGSGKSTLLKLFMRFYSASKGSVRISGRSVEEINTVNLRDMESYVTQETVLFHDSIRNNLCIAKKDATDEELKEACRKASILEFVEHLPMSLDTPVSELGSSLSSGERQRIGLARAFLHDAPFVLLDEPTSNLDSLNEAEILRSIDQERADKTVVLVSHRPSTMRIADQVYSVENGRLS